MDDALAFIVDGNDRIVEVVPTEVDITGFEETGLFRLTSFDIDIPQWEGQDKWRDGRWRIIYELPFGCFEMGLPNMKSGDTLEIYVGDSGGTSSLRHCISKPAAVETAHPYAESRSGTYLERGSARKPPL